MYWLEIIAAAITSFFIAIIPASLPADSLTIPLCFAIFIALWPIWTITFIAHRQNTEILTEI